MLIDPQGLFYGERISACSDEAQLHFPRLMAASNGYGRIEMSVTKLHATVYAGFKVKPSREELQKWFREYHANFLLFVYRAQSGEVWGQWAVLKGKLPKWKTAEDNRSPAPQQAEFDAYQKAYIEAKRAQYALQDDHIGISEDFKSLPKASEGFRNLSHGEVVGECVGVGEVEGEVLAQAAPSPLDSGARKADKKTASGPHPLHTDCKFAIFAYWSKHVQPDATPTWDGSEAKALDGLLRATPGLTLERVRKMLSNRGASDVNPSERPRRWIANLTDYELGALDAYGKPKALKVTSEPRVGMARPPGADQTRALLDREEANKRDIVDYWRSLRDSDRPTFEKCPAWVKEILNVGAVPELAVA